METNETKTEKQKEMDDFARRYDLARDSGRDQPRSDPRFERVANRTMKHSGRWVVRGTDVAEHLRMTTAGRVPHPARPCPDPSCLTTMRVEPGVEPWCAIHAPYVRVPDFVEEDDLEWAAEIRQRQERADAERAAEGNIGRFHREIPAVIPAGRPIQSGDHVMAHDRANFGRVVEVYAERGTARVWFWNKERNAEAEVELPLSLLERQ